MAHRDVALHILYGIPCVGKSTGAVAFAHANKIRTVIHTDYIREVQRGYVSEEDVPVLSKVTHNAWELYGPPTRENIVAGFVSHAEAVSPAVNMVARKLVDDGFAAVVEGAHFYSRSILKLRNVSSDLRILPTLLIVGSVDDLRQRAIRKGQQRASGVPLNEWQENIPAMLAIQDFLISDATENGIRVCTAEDWRKSWESDSVGRSTWIML